MKKRILSIVLFFTSILYLSACSTSEVTPPSNAKPTPLDTPVVSYNKGIISWDKIPNAAKYEVSIDNQIYITYQNKYELNVSRNYETHNVQVKAISETQNYLNSIFSKNLRFETKKLNQCSPRFRNNTGKRSAELFVDFNDEATDYYKLYINNNFIDDYYEEELTLQNELFSAGENIVSIYGVSKNPYICDSNAVNLKVAKYADFESIEIRNGQLLCSINDTEIIYDTSSFPIGESNQLIENNEHGNLPGISDSYISSSGITLTVKKLTQPELISGTVFLKDNSNIYPPFVWVANITLKNTSSLSIDKVGIQYSLKVDYYKKYLAYCTELTVTGDEISCNIELSAPEHCRYFTVFIVKDGFIRSDPLKI